MIGEISFISLAIIGVILAIYAFIDNQNQYFGNLIALLISSGLFGWLGLSLQNGNIGTTEQLVQTSTVIDNVTTLSYVPTTTPMMDSSLGILFIGIGSGLFIILLLLIAELIKEKAEEELD